MSNEPALLELGKYSEYFEIEKKLILTAVTDDFAHHATWKIV
jgi:hypothetical protein